MKKIIFFFTAIALVFSLVACSKTAGQTTSIGSTSSLSTAAELLVGTLKLEGTGQAVTADQAKQLLPLWQMLQSLSISSTAATEEIQAVVDQIKAAMTSDQVAAITAMKLTQQDMFALMSQNMTSASGTAVATPMTLNGMPGSDNSSSGNGMPSGGNPPSGGMPSGAPPSGGMPSGGAAPSGNFPAGGNTDGDTGTTGGTTGMTTTPQAVRSNGMADQLPAPLLNMLLELLQKKIQS